jgi:hypothetical protein
MGLMKLSCRRPVDLAATSTLFATACVSAPLRRGHRRTQMRRRGRGELQCWIEPGLDCVYAPAGVIPEYYRGSISKIGIDLGFNPAA